MLCQSQNNQHLLQIFEYVSLLVVQTHHIWYGLSSQSQNYYYAVVHQLIVHSLELPLHAFQDMISVLIPVLFLTSVFCLVLQEHSFPFFSLSWQFHTDQATNSWVFNLQYCLSYTDCYTEELSSQFYNSDSWHSEHCWFSSCLAA